MPPPTRTIVGRQLNQNVRRLRSDIIISLWHHPADPADILDNVLSEFAADIVDQHVDGVALDFVTPAVKGVFQLRAGENCPGTFHQGSQQGEFPCRQDLRDTAQPYLSARKVWGNFSRTNFRVGMSGK